MYYSKLLSRMFDRFHCHWAWFTSGPQKKNTHKCNYRRYLGKIALLSLFSFHSTDQRINLRRPAFLSHVPVSASCPWKRKGQAQTAWERLTTRGSEQRNIKGHPICRAAYAHPHIHKHRLTYLGLLSLKFITSDRTITLFDSLCVWVNYKRGEFSS